MGNIFTRRGVRTTGIVAAVSLLGALLTASAIPSTAYNGSTGSLPIITGANDGHITLVVGGTNTAQDTVAARSFYTPATPGAQPSVDEWNTELDFTPAYMVETVKVVAWTTPDFHGINISIGERQLVQWQAKSWDNDEDNTALPGDVKFLLPGAITFQVIRVNGHDQLVPHYKGYALHLLCQPDMWSNTNGSSFQSNLPGWSAGGYTDRENGTDSHVSGKVMTTEAGFSSTALPLVTFQTLTEPAIVGSVQQYGGIVRLNTCQTS